jgi:Phage major capsid protein E
MPSPGFNSQHIDAVLSNISVAYIQNTDKFIATKVFPRIPVEKASALYFKYNQEDWLRDEAKKRADTTESAGSGYNLSQDSYNCEVWAIHKDVGDQAIANATSPLQPIQEATNFVASRLLLRQEVDFAQKYFKAGVWANNFTGVASAPTSVQFIQWSNYVSSTPLLDVEVWKEAIVGKTGFMPNKMIMGRRVFNALKSHPTVIERIKYTGRDIPTRELLAALFDVDEVLVAETLVNTAAEGQAKNIQYNFGDGVLLVYTAPSPGLLTPSAGYTFVWNGVSDGAGLAIGTVQFRMEELRAQRIESQMAWDNKVVAADLGLYAASVVAAA